MMSWIVRRLFSKFMHREVKCLTTTHNSVATVHGNISSNTQRLVLTTLLLLNFYVRFLAITTIIPVVNCNPKPVLLQTKGSKHKETLHWETHTRTIPRLELHYSSTHTLVQYIVDTRVAYVCQLVHLEVNQQEKEHACLHDGTKQYTRYSIQQIIV